MPIRLSEGTKISQWYPLQPLWFSISSNLENLDISGFSGDLGHLPFARACPPHRLRKMLMPDVVLHANHLPPLLDPSAETLEVFACRVLPNGSMFDEEGSIFDLLFKCEKLQKLSIEILPSSYPTGKAEALSSILMLLQRVGVKVSHSTPPPQKSIFVVLSLSERPNWINSCFAPRNSTSEIPASSSLPFLRSAMTYSTTSELT